MGRSRPHFLYFCHFIQLTVNTLMNEFEPQTFGVGISYTV